MAFLIGTAIAGGILATCLFIPRVRKLHPESEVCDRRKSSFFGSDYVTYGAQASTRLLSPQ